MTFSVLHAEIPRRCGNCRTCSTPFSSGDSYCSILKDTDRHDFCIACWGRFQDIPSGCHWKSTVPLKKETPSIPPTKFSVAVDLLRAGDAIEPAEAFLLALYLVRKRILAFRKDYRDGDRIFGLYEVISTEEMIPVRKVSLAGLDLESVKASIAFKLSGNRDEK